MRKMDRRSPKHFAVNDVVCDEARPGVDEVDSFNIHHSSQKYALRARHAPSYPAKALIHDEDRVFSGSEYHCRNSSIVHSSIDSGYGLNSCNTQSNSIRLEKCDSLGSLPSGLGNLDLNNGNSIPEGSVPPASIKLTEISKNIDTVSQHSTHTKDIVQTSERHLSSNRYHSDEGFYSGSSGYSSHNSIQRTSIPVENSVIELKEIPEDSRDVSDVSPSPQISNFSNEISFQNEEGDTILHLCIIDEDLGLFNRILAQVTHYSLLNIQNNSLQTPLHLAVIQNFPHIVRRLVSYGATIDTRDRQGDTALHIACKRNRMECVLALTTHLERRDVKDVPYTVPFQRVPQNQDIFNYDGQTCLHIAAENVHFPIVTHLLTKCGADINMKEGKAGETILHQAVVRPSNERLVAHLLTSRHCDVNARRYDGKTAYQIAYGLSLLTMQQLLLRTGADDFVDLEDDQGEEMMDMSEGTCNDVAPSPQPLIHKTPPREDDFVYDDIKIGGELVVR